MDNKAILEEMAKQLAVLEQHISRLKKKPEKLHDIDVDVMGEKLKEIYTLLHNLLPEEFEESLELDVRTSEMTKVPMVELKPEPEIPAPKAPEMKAESEVRNSEEGKEQALKTEDRESQIEVEEKIVEEANPQPPVHGEQPPVAIPQPPPISEQPPTPSPQPPDPTSREPQPTDPTPTVNSEGEVRNSDPEPAKTTADLFSGPKTIADSFQAEEDNSIAATVHPQPAQDLKLAIGINDKFLFINELFHGDPSIYNQAIENMNSSAGLAQALSALDGYRAEYNWADNSEAYHRLKKIVNSKYNG